MRKLINVLKSILFVFIVTLIMPKLDISASKNTDKYDVNITYGIDGKYKSGKYIPINIEVKNLEKDFNGEVEIRVPINYLGGYDSYSKEISAKDGEDINVTIPTNFGYDNSKATLCLSEDGKVVYEKKISLNTGRVSEGSVFTGLLTDDATALGYLGNIAYVDSNYSNEIRIDSVKINEDLLNENGLNIDALDVIIINNYNMANLKEEDYNALNNWVNDGGTLLIGTGANESKTISNINKNFLNISSEGTSEINVNIYNENLNLILSKINLEDSSVINESEGNKLVYSLDRGKGRIVAVAFDLGLEPFISSRASTTMIEDILKETFNKVYEQRYNYGHDYEKSQAITMLANIPVEGMASTVTLGIILVIYVLLIGIIIYLILKKLNRRELIWFIIPITAIAFTILIYLLGNNIKLKDTVVNSINIISTDKDGRGQVKGYVGIASKNKGDIKIAKEETSEMKYVSEEYYYYVEGEDIEFKNLRIKKTYEDNNSYFTIANNASLQMNNFEVTGKEVILPKIENSLKIVNGKLNGNIKNNLDSDIKKLIIVSGDSIWDLGKISKGEEVSITDLDIKNSLGLLGYSEALRNEYYDAKWGNKADKKDIKFKNVEQYCLLMELIGGNNYIEDGTKIIAITDMPIDYSLILESKSVSNYDLTAIIQDCNIDFEDAEGNITFPEGYFKYNIISQNSNVTIDYYDDYIYGEGEIVLEYKVDDNVDIKEVTINCFKDRWGNEYGLNGKYYIYNYNTNQYEEFKLTSGSYKFENNGDYTLDNKIKIKVVASNDDCGAPKLIIKGVKK